MHTPPDYDDYRGQHVLVLSAWARTLRITRQQSISAPVLSYRRHWHAVRRNAEQLAAAVAGATPRAFQRFLSEAPWDHCPIIDGLQAMLGPLLQSEQGRWVLKEIAFAKRGHHSVGVARPTS